MKKLASLKGAKALSKQEQQRINGGGIVGGCENLHDGAICAGGFWCCDGVCTQYESFEDYLFSCKIHIHPGHGE